MYVCVGINILLRPCTHSFWTVSVQTLSAHITSNSSALSLSLSVCYHVICIVRSLLHSYICTVHPMRKTVTRTCTQIVCFLGWMPLYSPLPVAHSQQDLLYLHHGIFQNISICNSVTIISLISPSNSKRHDIIYCDLPL